MTRAGGLHQRGVIHANDVIMQCKFPFSPRKGRLEKHQDTVIYFVMAVLQLQVATLMFISSRSDSSGQICFYLVVMLAVEKQI